MAVRSIDGFFEGKSDSRAIFDTVAGRISACGPSEIEVKTQISFGANRKFAWFWLYNVTKKNPSGVPHLMLALDHPVEDPHVREITQVGNRRWNHQIVIRTEREAGGGWLGDLIEMAYDYGGA
jgi:hypothetical protein